MYGLNASSHDARVRAYREASALLLAGVLLRRMGLALDARNEARNDAGVTVAVDCEDVSGVREVGYFAVRRWVLAGTAVWVELVEAEELEGVGEHGRVGVGVMVEEGSALVVGREEVVGDAGVGAGDGGSAVGFWTSDVRYCSCRDVSDAMRRYEHQLVTNYSEATERMHTSLLGAGSSVSYCRNSVAYVHSPSAGRMLRQYTSSTFSYPSSGSAAGNLHASHSSIIPRPAAGQPILALESARVTRTCAGR